MISKATAAEIAAKWWTEEVRLASLRFNGDKGSPTHKGNPGHLTSIDAECLAVFERTLRDAIAARLDTFDWREENPQWASSLRVIGADYGPDLTIDKAFRAAGISTLLCPTKTYMWINPDKVFTNSGYEYTGEVVS